MSAVLSALIARVEAATGPDRELDAEIFLACTPGATRNRTGYLHKASGRWCDIDETRDASRRLVIVPAYTASLDAAVSLVPEGKLWVRLDDWTGPMEDGTAAPLSSASVYLHARNADGERLSGVARARAPALALCAAALRALLAGEDGK